MPSAMHQLSYRFTKFIKICIDFNITQDYHHLFFTVKRPSDVVKKLISNFATITFIQLQ